MIIKQILFIPFLLFYCFINSQELKSDFACTYKLDYTIGKKKDNEQFIMYIDAKNKRSFFQSTINYAKDTIDFKDPIQLASYNSDFNEKVLFEKNSFKVFENVMDAKLSYLENQQLSWTILEKIKKEDNITMQLAKTNAYGRTWYAWFSKDIPIDFGPYKFNGLPGFIVSVFDEKKEFIFTLQKFTKRIKSIKLPNPKGYKTIQKNNFNNSRFKVQTMDTGIIIFNNANERKAWFDKMQKMYKNIPLLDIEYPIK